MNQLQRVGIFVAVLLAFIVLGLHSPWTGYEIDYWKHTSYIIGQSELVYLPFDLWQTKAPVSMWFGYVLNIVCLLCGIAILLAVWLHLFKTDPPVQKRPDA